MLAVSAPVLTALAKVATPATLTLSKFVCPSTSISPFKSKVVNVDTPVTTKVFALTSEVEPPPA